MAAFGASVAIWERDVESCGSAAEAIGALGIVADVVTATRSTQPWSALPPNSDR
jgi:hypothetical protein